MTQTEIEVYKEAFRLLWERERWSDSPDDLRDKLEMEKLDRTSMFYQALLHKNYCVHRNWWFLPWHRAYLFYFERLLQEAVRDLNPPKSPTIPYWNWTDDRDIPPMFRGKFPDNPLGNNRRFYSRPLEDRDVGEGKIITSVDNKHSFTDFGSWPATKLYEETGDSEFENTIHTAVHFCIGGKRDGRLGDLRRFETAAFDPIFWSHHANIDRLWNRWLCNREREHKNPDITHPQDKPWHEMRFDMFVDKQRKKLNKTVAEIMDCPEIRSVVYLPHGEEPPQCVPPIPLSHRSSHRNIVYVATAKADHHQPLIINKGTQISVSLDALQRRQLATIAATETDQDDSKVVLLIRGIRLNEKLPDLYVRAFLNKRANAATPSSDESHIGHFFLYLTGHRRQHPIEPGQTHIEEFNHALHLTPALRRLQRLGKLNSAKPLEVTLVLLPTDDSASDPKPPANLKLPFREAILQISR